MLRVIVLILTIANSLASKDQNENPVVTTSMGQVRGSVLTTLQGKPIYAFRGIRFATAPVGALRFEPPVPILRWEGVYDATEDGAVCPQPGITPNSEDCLFLNVYTNKLPKRGDLKRPVIVYLHPGGYYSLTGSSVWAGPQYFLDQDIVLVSLNYRLGSLGFLSTGDELAPGNNGMKDQVLALKWIKQNIEAFGGDCDSVTLVGYSAGAASSLFHVFSPMSTGLFHRAVVMSSSIFPQLPMTNSQLDVAQKQARILGCPDDTSANIIKCLRTKSAQELADSFWGFGENGFQPLSIWTPVIEPDFGQERFIVENPVNSVMKGDFVKMPIMTGITKDEFAGRAVGVIRNATLLGEMDRNFENIAPFTFAYERNTENSKRISRELRKSYLGDGPLHNASLTGLAKLYADSIIGFKVNRAAKLMSTYSTKNLYYYCFTYQGRYSYYYWPGTETPYGVVHHDELIYLFYISPRFPKFNLTSPEYQMVKKLSTLIANFAYTGNPIPEPNRDLDNVSWIPFTTSNNKYMDIGEKLVMKENLYDDRYKLWEKLFPLSNH